MRGRGEQMRKKAERRWTVMVVPHGSGSSRAGEVSQTFVKALVGIGSVVALTFLVLGVAAISRGVNITHSRVLENENRLLADEIQRMRQRMTGLRDTLQRFGKREQELRLLAGLTPTGPPIPACWTIVSVGVSPASSRNSCSRFPNRCNVNRSPVMRWRIRWISSASSRFSFSSTRLCVMFTPREMAATPSTRNVSATTLPIPTSAFTNVCDTSTARDEPEPCGTTIRVQRRSAFLRIASRRPHLKTIRLRRNRAPVLYGPAVWRTRTGRGVRSPVWTSKVRLDWKAVNTAAGEPNHHPEGL